MKFNPHIWFCLGLALPGLLLSTGLLADDNDLDEILARQQIRQPLHYDYQETQYLQLLQNPREARGELFFTPRKMVIVQRQPEPATTLISAYTLLHVRPHQAASRLRLKKPFAVPGMEPLMQLLYGQADQKTLTKNYQLKFSQQGNRWTLELNPLPTTKSRTFTRLLLSGEKNRHADRLVLKSDDGDRSEWQWILRHRGRAAEQRLGEILQTVREPDQP